MTRMPAVADRFYPGKPDKLKAAMDMLVPVVPDHDKIQALAVVMPHAGYIYSGAIAGATISRVLVPATVLIMGPNHHGHGVPLALGMEDWQMPFGTVAVDRELAGAVLRHAPKVTVDENAHLFEHSLEVQVPFLQQVQPELRIVPLVVSQIPYALCQTVGNALAAAIRSYGRPVLMVASTDMSHYESRARAGKKDQQAIDRILALDPEGLYNTVLGQRITMCGVIPTTVVLHAALALGATRAGLVRYTDSGEASGDTSQVVGYAGMIIS